VTALRRVERFKKCIQFGNQADGIGRVGALAGDDDAHEKL
jgi:hypothetical protein